MTYQTDWLEIEVDNDRYRVAVQPSNSTSIQGKVKVEKYVGESWEEVGWNGILNLFDKLPEKWEVPDND